MGRVGCVGSGEERNMTRAALVACSCRYSKSPHLPFFNRMDSEATELVEAYGEVVADVAH